MWRYASEIAQANKATIIAMAEVATYARSHRGKSAWNESRWALCLFPFGSAVKFVPALHSSGYEIDGVMTYMGEASGIILKQKIKNLSHFGNAALFSDVRLFAKDKSIDAGVLTNWRYYTVGQKDAL